MRSINKILGSVVVALLFAMLTAQKTQAQPGVSISFQTFYDELSPYGTWVDDPDYGDVWVPDAEQGFKPYATRGHWVITDYGNTWVSDYEWGWAPFHYGRWRYDDYYGWEWIPGSEWGPAWVNWRTGGDYYAWAPLGPRISIDISFGNDYIIPDDYWICAPRRYITSPYIYNYYVPRTRVVNIIHNTTIINNVYVNNNRRFVAGPRREDIQRYSGRPVRVYQLGNASRPGATVVNNNTINVYRPTVIRNTRGDDRPRPARVVDARAYRDQHPNEGIASRGNNGATIHHENASRLAQTARDPQAINNNVVRVNRPGAPSSSNGNNTPTNSYNNNRGARPTRDNGAQPGQPAVAAPANTPNNNKPEGQNNNGRFGRDRDHQPQPTPTAIPNTGAPAEQNNNNGRFGRNRNTGQPTTTTPPNQQAPANNPVVTPAPTTNPATTNPDNGRFNRNRGNRPTQNTPAPNQQSQQDQAARQQAEQAAQQQQQDQQRQQAAQQQRQQQEQQRQEMLQRNLQRQQERSQQMQRPQPQQQQPQPRPEPQRQQPQQQRPQPQPQQQQPRPQPQQRPQRQEEHRG